MNDSFVRFSQAANMLGKNYYLKGLNGGDGSSSDKTSPKAPQTLNAVSASQAKARSMGVDISTVRERENPLQNFSDRFYR